MIPSVQQCFDLMAKYEMLENIKAHSIMVEKIATLLAKRLNDAGEKLRVDLVTTGALLHDIAKSLCLNSVEDHAGRGFKICLEHQMDEIADIVGEHIRLKRFETDGPVSEMEIVYYADKRVNHDRIVGLDQRLEYLLAHYGRDEEWIHKRIRDNFRQCKEVEKKIFAKLPFSPDALEHLVM